MKKDELFGTLNSESAQPIFEIKLNYPRVKSKIDELVLTNGTKSSDMQELLYRSFFAEQVYLNPTISHEEIINEIIKTVKKSTDQNSLVAIQEDRIKEILNEFSKDEGYYKLSNSLELAKQQLVLSIDNQTKLENAAISLNKRCSNQLIHTFMNEMINSNPLMSQVVPTHIYVNYLINKLIGLGLGLDGDDFDDYTYSKMQSELED
jgi:hypothetical protein